MKIAVCDDSHMERGHLEEVLGELSSKWILEWDTYTSGEELVEKIDIDSKKYDLFILDIEMQGINGIDLAHELFIKNRKAIFIFVTNYSQYAIQAFDLHVAAYITKPITAERLDKELTKIKPFIREFGKKFTFMSNWTEYTINCNEILYFEKIGRNLMIQTEQGEFRSNMSLKEVWNQIDEMEFAFTHRSYIVNLSKISKIAEKEVVLDDGVKVPISRSYKEDVRKQHLDFLERIL